ncbi:MAG: sodium:calcium antiporter [Myxococcota bacterium]
MSPWLTFAALAAVLVAAGTALARAADEIAEATGVGRLWIGTILLAAATSLPEAATDVAAVRMGELDLAAGDLFGSSLANMLILAVVDLLPPRGRMLRSADPAHALSAAQAIVLHAIAALFLLFTPSGTVLGVGPGPLLLAGGYLLGTRVLFRHTPPAPVVASSPRSSVRTPALKFTAAAGVVLLAAPSFAWSAERIAEATGLGTTFVGTLLVGLSTSLPELVASLAALRMGAYDLAVGNLFGSNAFNMAIFVLLDLAHPGSLFGSLDPEHALTCLLAILLMGFGLAAVVYRPGRKLPILDPDSLMVLLLYFAGIAWLYARAA